MFRLSNLIKSTLENQKSRTLNGSIMIWNFTNRCNLLCHNCYSKADANEKDTLTFEEKIEKDIITLDFINEDNKSETLEIKIDDELRIKYLEKINLFKKLLYENT